LGGSTRTGDWEVKNERTGTVFRTLEEYTCRGSKKKKMGADRVVQKKKQAACQKKKKLSKLSKRD